MDYNLYLKAKDLDNEIKKYENAILDLNKMCNIKLIKNTDQYTDFTNESDLRKIIIEYCRKKIDQLNDEFTKL